MLVEPILFLPLSVEFLILVLEDFVESKQLLVEQCQFVLVIIDEILIIAQLHNGDLILLALLLVIIDLPSTVLQQLTTFADLVLQRGTLILEANSHFSDFSVDHRLALAFHHVSQVFKLLSLALLGGLVAGLPLLDLLGKVIRAILLGLVLLLE